MAKIEPELFFNAIDGILRRENTLIFMTTTNFFEIKETIDLNRIDLIVNFTHPKKNQIKEMFKKYFPNQIESFDDFNDKISNKGIHFRQLEKFFFINHDCANILSKLDKLFELNDQRPNKSNLIYN